jgi:hypothetical protein
MTFLLPECMAGLLASPDAPMGELTARSSLTIFLIAPEVGVRTFPFIFF